MAHIQPDHVGEGLPQNGADAPQVKECPHCGEKISEPSVLCPHCYLPLEEAIQSDTAPVLPTQRWRRLLQPRVIIIAVVTVAVALGLYGFFIMQSLSADYHIAAGDRLLAEGDFDGAVEKYEQALKLDPQNPKTLEKLGWAEYQLARDVDALKHFENALALVPDRVMSLYGAGLASYQLRDYEKSSLYLNRVIEISPGHAGAYEYLGLAEYRLGRYEAAYEYLSRAWIYNPQNGTTIYYLARILFQRGQAQLAVENFNQAEKLGFDPSAVAVARGLAWMQAGNYQSARDDLQKVLTASPTRKDANLYLAKAFYLLEDYSSAQAQLASLQTDIPPSLQVDYFALSGWITLRQGSPSNALAAFNQWLNLNPNDEQALNAMGWAALYAGECQTAKFYFDGASQVLQGEWTFSPDSLAGADETPQAGLAAECQ